MTAPSDSQTPRSTSFIARPDTFEFIDRLLGFLERLGLTLDDAEQTIRHGCDLSPTGLDAAQVTNFFAEAHSVPDPEVHHVRDLAALLLYRGKIARVNGRYVSTTTPDGPRVVALVSVPLEDWGAFELGRYIHRGRAAYVAGPGDRA